MPQAEPRTRWWGRTRFDLDQMKRWRIGSCQFWARRTPSEWQLLVDNESQEAVDSFEVEDHVADFPDAYKRYVFNRSPETLEILPVLSDRPFVYRMERPFYLMPRHQVTIYIASPCWLSLRAGEENVFLDEFPIIIPSDTWFGPNFREGEICYAAKTFARLTLDESNYQTYHALTTVHVHNNADESVPIERMRIPLRNLALFVDSKGNLWSQSVQLTMNESLEVASVKVLTKNPGGDRAMEKVSPARDKSQATMTRVFNTLLTSDKWR